MAHEMHMGDDGILRVKFSGDFDTKDVEAYMADFAPIVENATQTIDFLVDVSEVGKASANARRAFGDIFRNPHPSTGRTALFGDSRYIRVVTGFVLRITGSQNLRIFDSEQEALAWLKQ
jgi:hypothetical protein